MLMKIIKEKNSGIWMLRQKKAMFDTIVTIFSILFLVFIFIIFAFLFSQGAKQKQKNVIDSDYSSLNTELMLKTFLKSTPYDLSKNPAVNMNEFVGGRITNADLVSWTCNNEVKEKNYKALKSSVNNFFDGVYDDDWEMWILYSNPDVKKKGFGPVSGLEGIWTDIKKTINSIYTAAGFAGIGNTAGGTAGAVAALSLISAPYRKNGFASQLIPCQDGTLASVMFYSHNAYFEIKLLK
jgi:hypothetical protein